MGVGFAWWIVVKKDTDDCDWTIHVRVLNLWIAGLILLRFTSAPWPSSDHMPFGPLSG